MTQLPQTSGKLNRKPHLIRKTAGTRYPSRYVFFDTETKDIDGKGTQEMILAYALFWEIASLKGREKKVWFDTTDPDALYRFMASKTNAHTQLIVLSANIWFDLRVSGLLPVLKRREWVCSKFFSRGHTFIASFKKGKHRIEFVNIQNYFNFPVVKIGESIGLPKLDIDLKDTTIEALRAYCKRDVEIIYEAFRALYFFIRTSKLGSMRYTLPSISYSCYTHTFIPKSISVHTQEDILELERNTYFGGRCECFSIGRFEGQRFYKMDVNSMYPFIMKENYFPHKFEKVGYDIPISVIEKNAHKWLYCAEVELETDKPIYPYRRNNKLIFPVGKFTAYLTTASLLHAIQQGHVKKIKVCAAYKKAKLFTSFVDYFYSERLKYRKENNPAFAYICKLILNSLYGKFGQRSAVTISEGQTSVERNFRELIWHVQKQKYYIHQIFYGLEQTICLQEEEGLNSMPAIAAHVTDYARIYLWYIIEKAGLKNCFYCDTDSIIVNRRGYKRLQDDLDADILGMIKVEEAADYMEVRGAKNYTFGKTDKIKGIKKSATKIGENTYQYSRFPTPVSELRDRLKEDYRIETVQKTLSAKYDKGIVTESGVVIPHHLP